MRRFFLLSETAVKTFVIEFLLLFLPFKKVVQKLKKRKTLLFKKLNSDEKREVIRISGGLSEKVFGSSRCLNSSLVLFWIDPEETTFFLGLPDVHSPSEAHAWLKDIHGNVFSTDQTLDYKPIFSVEKKL